MPSPLPPAEASAPDRRTDEPAAPAITLDRVTRRARWVELITMFLLAPTALALFMRGPLVFPAIWTLAALCLILLLRDRSFPRRDLWNARGVIVGLRPMLRSFLILAPLLAVVLWLYEPERIFSLPREKPVLWLIIMLGYPILSVYPQEIAFRAFFVHRYSPLMGRNELIVTSAVAFGYAHIIMQNPIAIGFSAFGGALFTVNYLRTRSLLSTCIEHALYGCFLFTIGWGYYFYGGSTGR